MECQRQSDTAARSHNFQVLTDKGIVQGFLLVFL